MRSKSCTKWNRLPDGLGRVVIMIFGVCGQNGRYTAVKQSAPDHFAIITRILTTAVFIVAVYFESIGATLAIFGRDGMEWDGTGFDGTGRDVTGFDGTGRQKLTWSFLASDGIVWAWDGVK